MLGPLQNQVVDDDLGGQNSSCKDKSSAISCSICLDVVTDNGDRSKAKLLCGHEFHLDCIGSAFNVKGAMQCPNCRKIEKGRWLYASGPARTIPEFHIEDWTVDEDPYELSYTEMPLRVHWCPFSGFTQVHSAFEDIDSPGPYHDLQRYRAEHDPTSSVAPSYIAYFGPLPPPPPLPPSSNTIEIHEDTNEMFNPHHLQFPIVDIQYQSWDQQLPPIPLSSSSSPSSTSSGTHTNNDQAMIRPSLGRTVMGEFRHPFPYSHGVAAPGSASLFSSFVHPAINAPGLPHERRQFVSHSAVHHQQPNNNPLLRRLNNNNSQRSSNMQLVAAQPDNHGRGFFLVPSPMTHETESLHHRHHHHHHPWERDSFSRMSVISFDRDPAFRGSFHRSGGFVSGSRTGGGFWQRHWP